ncbi:hypothetical protein BKA82DRAFT_4066975 [Pisolithus tinctorius]|nr:hypothetical protein BKA82DRAFT_4066975 [Pisolithus tinctorius]
MALDFVIGKLYANSLLASLNTRQHLQSRGSGSGSPGRINDVHFPKPPKLSKDWGSSKDGERHFNGREGVVIDITAVSVHDKITTLQREGEV